MTARIVALIAAGAVVGCGGDDGSGSGADSDQERAERCAAINEWSFQEGNAISEHPRYDWWQENCE